jgi:hypothetical protein
MDMCIEGCIGIWSKVSPNHANIASQSMFPHDFALSHQFLPLFVLSILPPFSVICGDFRIVHNSANIVPEHGGLNK